jgi:hypothetical protein
MYVRIEALTAVTTGCSLFLDLTWMCSLVEINEVRVRSASWVRLGSCLEEGVAAPVWRAGNAAVGICRAGRVALSVRKGWTNFARSGGSLADSGQGV